MTGPAPTFVGVNSVVQVCRVPDLSLITELHWLPKGAHCLQFLSSTQILAGGGDGSVKVFSVQAHARELGVTYVIYEQQIWLAGNPTSQWTTMEDRGSRTANHYDHVHVSVS